jgi:hypothetical protein
VATVKRLFHPPRDSRSMAWFHQPYQHRDRPSFDSSFPDPPCPAPTPVGFVKDLATRARHFTASVPGKLPTYGKGELLNYLDSRAGYEHEIFGAFDLVLYIGLISVLHIASLFLRTDAAQETDCMDAHL